MTQDTGPELAGQLRTGKQSAAELMSATYDAIETWNPHVNALVSLLDRAEAIALAREADAGPPRGPLHGLPIAVKDLANARGFPTTMGSRLFAGAGPAEHDDIAIARIRAAGALIIGKSNTPEFGLGSHTVNPVHGATRNPWDLSRTAGGSSGGAAVALATGMLTLADGSDMMGSLRNPAGWTGTYGMRPTWGAVPSEPSGDIFLGQLSTSGPMARNPQDLGLLLTVMAGPDPRQPHGIDLTKAGPRRALRIGWLSDWAGSYATEDGILERCEAALQVLAELGHAVVPVDPGFSADTLWWSWTTLRSWQVAGKLSAYENLPRFRERAGANALWELERGKALSALDVHRASVAASQWYLHAAELFGAYDILALPTARCWPFAVETDWPREIAGQAADTYHRWMDVVIPASLAGLPALAVPAGLGANGLPMGLQLIGPRRSDFDLLALGQAFHERAPWSGAQPPHPVST